MSLLIDACDFNVVDVHCLTVVAHRGIWGIKVIQGMLVVQNWCIFTYVVLFSVMLTSITLDMQAGPITLEDGSKLEVKRDSDKGTWLNFLHIENILKSMQCAELRWNGV